MERKNQSSGTYFAFCQRTGAILGIFVAAFIVGFIVCRQTFLWRQCDQYGQRGACSILIRLGDLTREALAGDYLGRGKIYLTNREFAKAIADFSIVIHLGVEEGDIADAYFYRALSYAQQDEFDKAVRDSDAAVLLRSDWVKPYCVRAMIEYRRGNVISGNRFYSQAKKLNPHDPCLQAVDMYSSAARVHKAPNVPVPSPQKPSDSMKSAVKYLGEP